MELFEKEKVINILPAEGEAIYFGKIFTDIEAQYYLDKLLKNIAWKNDEVTIFGRRIITKRKVSWYGENEIAYTYSHSTKKALPWTKELTELKKVADVYCQTNFNSCLLNLYHNGGEGMGWHSDDEKSIERNSPIASFSFGAERKFLFKHKQTKDTRSLLLENGSFLVMKGPTQQYWLHSLPKSKKIIHPRVNLTFRRMTSSN
jgi:alkylated DNA repair dioxygenase AlkB